MENRINILNELREISPKLAEVTATTPYEVPAGYFDGLAGRILQRIKDGEEGSPVLGEKKDNPYRAPQGYFDNLATIILNRIKAETAETPKEELALLSPLLSQASKKNPFSTPAGYFEELGDNAVAGAKAIEFVNDELENLSPLMNELKSKQVYEVPAGYFEQLPEQVLQKVTTQQPARVVSISFTRKIIRYAAAAIVIGIMFTAGWIFLGKNSPADQPGQQPPAVAQIDVNFDSVSDDMLQSYLDNQNAGLGETTPVAGNYEITADDMKDMLADVSDAELQHYIDQYGNPKDILTN
jgi:hypothetical protein